MAYHLLLNIICIVVFSLLPSLIKPSLAQIITKNLYKIEYKPQKHFPFK